MFLWEGLCRRRVCAVLLLSKMPARIRWVLTGGFLEIHDVYVGSDDDAVRGVCCQQLNVELALWRKFTFLTCLVRTGLEGTVVECGSRGFLMKMRNKHFAALSWILFASQAIWNVGGRPGGWWSRNHWESVTSTLPRDVMSFLRSG